MRKYLLVAFIALSPIASYACSHDMLFSAPHMHNHEALVDALNQSQGKQPKPFNLKALPAKTTKNQFQAKGFRKLPGYKMPNTKAKA